MCMLFMMELSMCVAAQRRVGRASGTVRQTLRASGSRSSRVATRPRRLERTTSSSDGLGRPPSALLCPLDRLARGKWSGCSFRYQSPDARAVAQ